MSDRIHCDHCGAIIPRDVPRLTARFGIWKGDRGDDETNDRDYCRDCIESIPLLKNIYAEQFDEEEHPA